MTGDSDVRAGVFAVLWPAARRHRARTLIALALLLAAKGAAVGVPLLLKAIVERFGEAAPAGLPVRPVEVALSVFPALMLAYAATRWH